MTSPPHAVRAAQTGTATSTTELSHFARMASHVSWATGRPLTFIMCCLLIVVWGITGPIFHYSNTWQLFINTCTTIVTFLMVFLIQNTQYRDGAALQAKLDELIRVTTLASNELVGAERLPETRLAEIREDVHRAAEKNI